jgi:hypothetical protein
MLRRKPKHASPQAKTCFAASQNMLQNASAQQAGQFSNIESVESPARGLAKHAFNPIVATIQLKSRLLQPVAVRQSTNSPASNPRHSNPASQY